MQSMPKHKRAETTTTDIEIYRNFQLKAAAAARAQMKANEVALKKIYVDWLFDNLNLKVYK